MAQAYTSPDWSSGEGISASNLQSISNVLEGIVQGTDKAIHNIQINGSILLVTYVDGTTETFGISGMKGIVEVTKTSSGNVDTYTMIFTDGTTYSFTVTNGGGGGSSVIANPTLVGGEADLTALEVDGTKYKISGGGGNADKIELTKAEYDALPDTKLTDGKMYFITDWNENGKGNVYSSTEVVVGDWFGKPLYRKVVEEAFDSYSSAHQVPIGVTNYTPVNYDAFRIAPDGTMIKAFNQQSNSGYWLTVEKFASDGIYYRSAGWNSGTFRAIVEYTKN